MNQIHLDSIFRQYIESFELINNKTHNENYKWVAVQHFQDNWNPDAENFAEMLRLATAKTFNLIDDVTRPLRGLITLAKFEPLTVRQMLLDLYNNGEDNTVSLKEKITTFMQDSKSLIVKYDLEYWVYKQTPRSVMGLLALRHPEDNIFYKPREAIDFANFVEFPDDWGALENFVPEKYHRMCRTYRCH